MWVEKEDTFHLVSRQTSTRWQEVLRSIHRSCNGWSTSPTSREPITHWSEKYCILRCYWHLVLKTNKLSLSHAVVRLCNWQRSNVLADWAKNPDKPPIFENPPGQRPKKRTCPGKPGRMVTLFVRDYPGEPVPERENQSGFYWSKRQWVAVASAGPYASLHLAPDR